MSEQNMAIVRRLFEFWGTADVGRSFELYHDDIRMELAYEMPGFTAVHQGHEALRRFWREWLREWEPIRMTRMDFEGAGDRVLSTWTQQMTGRGSDVSMEQDHAAIWTLRDGKVAHVRYFMDEESARAEFER